MEWKSYDHDDRLFLKAKDRDESSESRNKTHRDERNAKHRDESNRDESSEREDRVPTDTVSCTY